MNNAELQLISSRLQRFSTRELDQIFQGYIDQELQNEIRTELRRRYAQSLNEFSKL